MKVAGAPARPGAPAVPGTLLCIAHRGSSARAPENTLAAFAAAIDDGADALEFDVRLTRDGVPVVLHDATLDRTTDGHGPVAAFDLADLRRLDAGGWFAPRFGGERVPTLAETLDLAHGRCGVNIELKTGDRDGSRVRRRAARARAGGARRGPGTTSEDACLVRAVAGVVAEARFRDLLIVSSFSRRALTASRAAMPRARIGWLASRTARGLRSGHAAIRLWSFHPHLRLATARRIAVARDLGLRVFVWPVNDPADARRLATLGVTGIMTDDPARMRTPGPS